MNPQDNASSAPVIPQGTNTQGGVAYNSLQASVAAVQNAGQAQSAPVVNSGSSQNAPEGTTFAELAQKKGFQTPDDLAKAYANLEYHNKKVEMTAADIIKAVQDAPAPVVAQPVPQAPARPPVYAQPQQNPDEAALNIVKAIVQNEVKPLQQTVELQQLFLNNPDAKEYAEGIAKAVKENPGISWGNAYKIAKFDASQQQAETKGQQEAYQAIQQKQTVLAGSPSPAVRATPDISSVIKDRNVPFREVDRMVREALANVQQ